MKSKIKVIIVRSFKYLLPTSFYKYFKNIYRIFKIDFEDINNAIYLLESNKRDFKLIRDEFERIKLRSIIVDGKLNYLLYGKVNDRSGTIDQSFIKSYKNKEEINSNVDFTIFLRGSTDSLKKRYSERLQNVNLKNILDVRFLNGKSLIDLGAGNGYVTSVFCDAYKFSTVVGVDSYCSHFEEEKIKSFEYINSDVMKFLSFTDKKFFFISAIHILEHLSLSDQYYFFKKCFDLLEYGGYLYIEVPNIYNYRTLADGFWADEQHLRLFPLNAFRVLSEKIGYTPYYGVYDSDNDFITLDEYLSSGKFFDNKYSDIFLILRKL